MNFFTPQRLLRLQNRSNDRTFLAALDEWENALDGYKARLARILVKLPTELQQLINEVSLHDAHVLNMWWGGRSQFTITLHPESDPSRLIVLTYSLVEPPRVEEEGLPQVVRSEPVAWLYDELELADNSRRSGQTFVHRILLSDGREVRLHFRDVAVRRPIPLVPCASKSKDAEKAR